MAVRSGKKRPCCIFTATASFGVPRSLAIASALSCSFISRYLLQYSSPPFFNSLNSQNQGLSSLIRRRNNPLGSYLKARDTRRKLVMSLEDRWDNTMFLGSGGKVRNKPLELTVSLQAGRFVALALPQTFLLLSITKCAVVTGVIVICLLQGESEAWDVVWVGCKVLLGVNNLFSSKEIETDLCPRYTLPSIQRTLPNEGSCFIF